MGKIVQLSKDVINKIAAGEVIERPFSVVKELVENSIDAGALKISVEVANECRDIRVADNGCGIPSEDIVLAFSKHATSKLKTEDDLFNIKTMGFRGEALASIISISKVTCITRTKESDFGTKVECENSEVRQTQTGCAVGTIMEVRDLFYNIPARLKFLKSPKTEFGYITEFMQSAAIIHPEISFELKFNGKTTFKTSPADNQLLSIKEIFSAEIAGHLKEVAKTDRLSGLKITGYVSSPDFTRASKKDYYLYVNSRLVKCPVFQKAIDMVYRALIGSKYPFIILNLEIPPSDVDVNVHPSKREVRYKNPNQIFNFIYSSVRDALQSRIEHLTYSKPDENSEIIHTENEENVYVSADTNISEIFSKPVEPEQGELVYFSSNKGFEKNTNIQNKGISAPSSIQSKLIDEPEYLQKDIIIGQYKKTYILIEKENGLEMVDQHIAEERYIYEKLKESKNIDCQLLFVSDVLPVSVSDKNLLETKREKLLKYGYEIDFISDTEVIFRKIPQILSKISPKDILADILENISGDIDNIEEKILITTSCKAAVKANTYLNQYQMEEIIKNWRTCKNPETCPHGRPISKFFEHKELSGFFQRNK